MAARSERRDLSKPGLAGLGPDDWQALAEGRTTVGELAARVGVSPAAVSRRRKRLAAAAAGGSSSPLSPAAAGAGVGPLPPNQANSAGSDGTTGLTELPDIAASFAMWALQRAHEQLAGGGLGPSAVKAATQAGILALDQLRQLGFLADEEDQSAPVELRVVVMTDEEAAALKVAPPDYREDDE